MRPHTSSLRFLSPSESQAWLIEHGLREDPETRDPRAFYLQFEPQPLDIDLREVVDSMMDDFGPFTGGLLRVTDWIWDDEYESDPTIPYREAQGEPRGLLDLPGFAFGEGAKKDAADLLALTIEHRWTAFFYFASGSATLQLCEGDRVDVYSADAEIEKRVRYRLIESGARFTVP